MIRFGSVCSGIEAASVSWEPLGWNAAWFSEIEPFPSAVLAHHWPDVPNLGDMTTIRDRILTGDVEAPDVFCGGTPCQAFSIAGKRGSLSDARGNLSLTFCEIANAIDDIRHARGEPSSVVFWENVPGCLNTHDNAFGCFLAGLAGDESALDPGPRPEPNRSSAYWTWKKESGEHVPKWPDAGCVVGPRRAVAWRVLEAQFFGLAQRRRRVFVVASAREGFNPAEVLFEFDGLRRDIAPSREAGEEFTNDLAPCLTSSGRGVERTGEARGQDPVVALSVALRGREGGGAAELGDEVAGCLRASSGGGDKLHVLCMAHGQGGAEIGEDRSPTLTCNHEAPIAAYSTNGIGSWKEGVGPLRARPQDSHEMLAVAVVHGTQDPCVGDDLAFTLGRNNGGENAVLSLAYCRDVAPTLTSCYGKQVDSSDTSSGPNVVAVAFAENSRAEIRLENGDGQITGALSTGGGKAGQGTPCIAFSCKDYGADAGPLSPTLRAMGHGDSHANAGGQVAVCVTGDITHTLTSEGFDASEDGSGRGQPIVACDVVGAMSACGGTAKKHGFGWGQQDWENGYCQPHGMAVRRLTPVECARLQGFPDNHTQIPWRKKPAEECPDGPQYKAYGNSWAVNVTRWIGQRIDARLRQCV